MAKISSTSIDALRPDVAANVHIGIRMLSETGLKVGVSCTYRNQEMQTYLHETEGAPRTVTFHGARLAFDIFQNIKGREWEDAFFNKAAVVFKQIGFSWMYDIADYDKCHFQWDENRKYKNADILSGRLPPEMPLYEDDENMTDEKFAEHMAKYLSVAGTGDHPSEWAKEATDYAKENGIFNGDGQGSFGWQKPISREAVAQVLYNSK